MAEAEYIATRLFCKLNYKIELVKTPIMCDNKSVINLSYR